MTEAVQEKSNKTPKNRIENDASFNPGLIALNFILVKLFKPIEPKIRIASESLLFHLENGEVVSDPWFSLPIVGNVYLTSGITATMLVILTLLAIAFAVNRQTSKGQLQSHGIVLILEMLFSGLFSMADNAVEEKWRKKIYPFFITVFLYVLIANLIKLVPIFETIGIIFPVEHGGYIAQQWAKGLYALTGPEAAAGTQGYEMIGFFRGASTDLNFTLAVAIMAVVMIQIYGVQAHGAGYFNKFLNIRALIKNPKTGFLDFFVGILEGISEVAKIASFGFRLFGNMFAGMVLILFLGYMVPWVLGSFLMLYEVFVGILQAFIFGMLTTVFMSMAVQSEPAEA